MRPSRDEMLMGIAQLASDRSTCSRAQVGAVISRDGRPMSLGYNGAPSGVTHCDHACDCTLAGPPPEGHFATCASLQPCEISMHAEANAIAFAARHGVATDGAFIHITWSPCLNCARLIINAGIVRVRWEHEYRLSDGVDLMKIVGIDCGRLV